MTDPPPRFRDAAAEIAAYPLLQALRERRSRRFGTGMKMHHGPFAYESRFAPVPLAEEEEAIMAFAACGITGHALADLCYARGEGGNIMAALAGRTIASGDGIQAVALVVTNDQATYLLKRPQDFSAAELHDLIGLARAGSCTEIYRRMRVPLDAGRAAPSKEPLFNINANRWSAYAPGTTYFLPINDLTQMYINGLLEILNETTAVFVLDERAGFQPAGLAPFARSKGGHLHDDPAKGRVATIRAIEQFVTEFVTVEQGMMLQNLGLASQALGLGGFPNFANHEFGWFQALGFRMESMPASRYLGAGRWVEIGMNLLGKNPLVPYPVGLERKGEVLLKPYCPPYYRSMSDAVDAVVARKFGPDGIFRRAVSNPVWRQAPQVAREIPELSPAAIAATKAYCEYVWNRYGRFPAHLPPYRTVLGFQACHVDCEFYDRFYQAEALSEAQRADFARWNGDPSRSIAPNA